VNGLANEMLAWLTRHFTKENTSSQGGVGVGGGK
jgi:hypothetical protein